MGEAQLRFRVVYISKICINKTYEVDSYFPLQSNCNVTFYQDAHCYQDMPVFANLMGPDGVKYEPRSCWTDVFHSIVSAQKIICITGWAVWHKLELFRGFDKEDIYNGTLGDLLLRKAEEGVKVYVMVWSEKTSGDIIGQKGVMGTHDMETYNFFKNTKVNCALAPRELGSINELTDVLQNEFATGAYTHHQKTIICDFEQYRLIAYVGGLDLTGGRWDTPDHELYSTLTNEHSEDFRNSNAGTVPPSQGPREPWHDIHCKVEGPIAHDVFINFYERWMQQGTKYGDLEPIDTRDININAPAPYVDPAKVWNCQLFRSITSDSAKFDPSRTEVMNSKKGRLVEASIAQAYIQMIRNAENFLYFENQYFLGSAYAWKSNDDVNCHHVIPREIAQKVVDKIYAEGDPASAPIQEILYWQARTIEMMYGRVGEALQHAQLPDHLGTHPTDWLLIMCPGKRELPGPHLDNLDPPTETMASKFRKTLRFPIYVHSKNVYCRRCIYTDWDWMLAASLQSTKSIWRCSHVQNVTLERTFKNQGGYFCKSRHARVCNSSQGNGFIQWQVYKGDVIQDTPGQLLAYPLNILSDGTIELLEDCKTFPDFGSGAKITGKVSAMIPQKVTT
ncbi:PLD1_2 [Lepeophtheirus salmonis]|uniref:phospholipase D n=1 Tax=Lepeophtheirus salmonis TaxID=72036 RepID=A0A7R8CYM1_LEPSM|nr:PLD1_2 [Lepeophtheirus salmonis]CAF2970334.1 PLD1_2 [Lepeophtheirus salmonis]